MRDINEAKKQCLAFIAAMKDNRPNCDDAGVARRILEDLANRSEPQARHRRRLTHWCHTDGTLYQRGVRTAQLICIAIYGRVLPREN